MTWALPKGDTYFAPILQSDPRGFELDHLEAALRHVKEFRVAVDGGAHIGTWSKFMAKRFAKVLAFEPAADTFACLAKNLSGLENIELRRVALGAKVGRGLIVDDPSRQGNTGARYLREGTGDVDVMPLDGFSLQHLDFLKLDLEGHEIEALKGAEKTLKQHRPTVLIECKRFSPPRNGGPERAATFLRLLGYREVARVRNDRIYVNG